MRMNLDGQLALVAGVADDQGFGWSIAKALHAAGAKVILACWPPAMGILTKSLDRGKLDMTLPGLSEERTEFKIEKIYALDAVYDSMDFVPEDIRTSKRYQDVGDFTIQGLKKRIKEDFGDGALTIAVHSLANGPEVQKPLLETSREGYLAANSASSYSFVSMVREFSPIMRKNGSFLCLSYLASEKVIPGYGGGMSSAKAALESDTRVLAYEAGQEYGHRVNSISAGALASRAARSIGEINKMIDFGAKRAPLKSALAPKEVGSAAAFLCSDLASGITGINLYVDKGMHAMGLCPEGGL